MSTNSMSGSLAVGTHMLRAVYSGVPGFGAAESPTVQVNVSRAYTAVSLTASGLTAVVGQPVIIFASVRATTGTGVTPGGAVTFYDGSTVLGSASVDPSGIARISADLRLGNHTLRAVYAGDAKVVVLRQLQARQVALGVDAIARRGSQVIR